MEILSKLWVAITTENETIVDIMSIFLLLIEMPLTLEFFSSCFENTCHLKTKAYLHGHNCTNWIIMHIFNSKAIQQHYYYDNYSIYNNESL